MTNSDRKDCAGCKRRTRRVAPATTLGISAGAALAAFILATAPTARADVFGDAASAIGAVDVDPFSDVFGTNAFTTGLDNLLPAQFATGADQFVNALGFDDPAKLTAAADPASLMRLDQDPFSDVFGTNAFTTGLDNLLPAQFATGADQLVNALGFDDPAPVLAAAAVDPALMRAPDVDPFSDVFGTNAFTTGLDNLLPAQFAASADQFVNALGFNDPATFASAALALDADPFADVLGTNAITTALDGLLPAQFALSADQFVDLFIPAAMVF